MELLKTILKANANWHTVFADAILLSVIVVLAMWIVDSRRQKKVVWPQMSKFKKLSEFLQDGTGALSATRLAFLATVFMILGTWVVTCWTQKKLLPFDNSQIYLIGALMAGKVAQAFSENSTPDSTAATIGKQPDQVTIQPVAVVQQPVAPPGFIMAPQQ